MFRVFLDYFIKINGITRNLPTFIILEISIMDFLSTESFRNIQRSLTTELGEFLYK